MIETTITNGKRKAIIRGNRVALLKLQNKRRDTGVWPETELPGRFEALHAALMWCENGFIEVPGAK